MTDISPGVQRRGRATLQLCLLIAFGLLLVIAANAHLFYVASISQPDCVVHLRQGEGSSELGLFSAAQSSCSSPPHARSGLASGRE
jgi:hypothetical protein